MTGNSPEDEERLTERRRVGGAVGFGTSFAVGMALFSLGGHWLDVKFEKEPIFTLAGVFMGLLYGGWELWKLTVETNRRSRDVNTPHDSGENEKHNGSHK